MGSEVLKHLGFTAVKIGLCLKSCLAVAKNLVISQRICKYCGFDCLGCRDFHPAHVWMQIMAMKPGRKFLPAASEVIMIQSASEHS